MRTIRGHVSVTVWVLLMMLLGAPDPDFAVARQASQKQVLALYSTRREAQLVTVGDRELPRIIRNDLAGSLDYYSEVMDEWRYSHPDYQLAFRDILRQKYQEHRFDVVVAMDTRSLEFLGTYRATLFPEAPIVFFRPCALQPSCKLDWSHRRAEPQRHARAGDCAAAGDPARLCRQRQRRQPIARGARPGAVPAV